MDRLLDTFIREPLGLEWPFGQRGCAPSVDLAETNEEVVVRAEIPGIDPDNLEVTVVGGQLVLAGEKKDVSESSGRDFYHTESRFGRFRRTIPLSQAVDAENAEANYTDGVLTIRFKKIPAVAPKRIEVKVCQGEASSGGRPTTEPAAGQSSQGQEG
jgi:HSP20 family protein